ncbi:DegV family protein [Frisingicoccus sp.]|uniref:DegV family protein n=1 Tax=Frisingicoccus sp. TaxID=1918627 RepID=UPI002E7A40AD|nr:DegV family protein [Frisingicoccus sp.]MEE0753195.1 DegV family protein [Frisingicoccus sp.]
MKTAVMTDSNSGITAAEGKELGVFIVPMPVIIDGVTYFEGKNLLQPDFFESLMSGKDVSTSQPSPGDLMELWNRVLALGYDDIVYIPMSSGLSNSYASAAALAEEYDHRVHVVDNHRISIPQLASVMDAVKLVSEGRTAGEIKELLEKAALEASIYIAVDTLEFLKKGGRVTPAAAAIGSVLGIKPLLSIQGDKLDAYAKVRGMKRCRRRLIEAVEKDLNERFSEGDMSKVRIATAGSFRNPELAEDWRQEVARAFPDYEVVYRDLGCSIESHTGPEAMAAGVFRMF